MNSPMRLVIDRNEATQSRIGHAVRTPPMHRAGRIDPIECGLQPERRIGPRASWVLIKGLFPVVKDFEIQRDATPQTTRWSGQLAIGVDHIPME